MNTMRTPLLLVFLLSFAVPGLQAQDASAVGDEGVFAPGELEQAVLEHERGVEADREAVREFLDRPDVRDLVHERNLDPDRLDAALDDLSGSDLRRLVSALNEMETAAQNRATVTISVGALLLILILVLLLS